MITVPSLKKAYQDPLISDLFSFYVKSDLLQHKEYKTYLEKAKQYSGGTNQEFRDCIKSANVAPTPDMFEYGGISHASIFELLISFDNFCKAVYDVITEGDCAPEITLSDSKRNSSNKTTLMLAHY